MPYKNGIVVNIDGNGWVEVVTDNLDACADCVSASNCPSDCKGAKTLTRVRDGVGAHLGDTVSVYISRKSMLKSAALLYLLPIVFLLIGAGTGSSMAPRLGLGNSTAALIMGLAGLCFGYFLVKAFSMRLSTESGFFPKIDRILYRGADDASPASRTISFDGDGSVSGWSETNSNPPPPH